MESLISKFINKCMLSAFTTYTLSGGLEKRGVLKESVVWKRLRTTALWDGFFIGMENTKVVIID